MRIINKKYLLIILLVGVIITGVIFLNPKEEVKLDNVILKQEVNNKTFAMYTETENGYQEYNNNKFPDMYVLNIEKSKCIDNNGNELKNVLSYENDKVVLTTNKSSYCYLYFDKSLGLEIKEKNPKGLGVDKVRGAMYRFQGQAKDENNKELVNNYICFGTSEMKDCTETPDYYMYRIIGIEASTGRVKVIKKEALNEKIAWVDNEQENIEFPDSKIYEAIKGTDFLENPTYVPEGWKEKISDNTWTYGDMASNDTLGAKQTGEGLYLAETGQKGTIWDVKAEKDDPGAQETVVGYDKSEYLGQPIYYIRHDGKWTETFNSKISLIYLHDYYLSVSDEANCQFDEKKYEECRTGWMHILQNDISAPSEDEWTMTRMGFSTWAGYDLGFSVYNLGHPNTFALRESLSVRPVFYINALEELLSGEGTIENPFIIKN